MEFLKEIDTLRNRCITIHRSLAKLQEASTLGNPPHSVPLDPRNDLPLFLGNPSIYIIASERRSGSHFLASLLLSSGQAGVPLEYFHARHWEERLAWSGAPSADTFCQLIQCRTSSNGVFGVKAHWAQYAYACRLGLEAVLRQSKFVRITRRDILAQAISLVIAQQSGSWICEQATTAQPIYSMTSIRNAILSLQAEKKHWERYLALNSIQHITLEYEDLCRDGQAQVRGVCEHLGIRACPRIQSLLKVQRGRINEEWRQRYKEDSASNPVLAEEIMTDAVFE